MHVWNRLCFDSQCKLPWTVIILAKIYIDIRNVDLVQIQSNHNHFDTCCHVMVLSNYPVRHQSTGYDQGVVAERSKALLHRSWRGGSNPAGDIFHFEFFNPSLFQTAQWIPCKWNQAWPFTCSHRCFRPKIQLILIQDLVCIYIRTIALCRKKLGCRNWENYMITSTSTHSYIYIYIYIK